MRRTLDLYQPHYNILIDFHNLVTKDNAQILEGKPNSRLGLKPPTPPPVLC